MPTTTAIPVLEQIRQNLLKTLAGIKEQTGYTFTAIVVEPDRLGTETGDGVLVLNLGRAEWNKDLQAAGLLEWVQEFIVTGYTVQNDSNAAPWDGQNIQRYADIQKALQQDPYRGDWAHDTLPEAPEWFKRTDGQHEGVGVPFYVRYRTQWEDPYTAR